MSPAPDPYASLLTMTAMMREACDLWLTIYAQVLLARAAARPDEDVI